MKKGVGIIEDFEKPQSPLSNRFENPRRTSKLEGYSKLSIVSILLLFLAVWIVSAANETNTTASNTTKVTNTTKSSAPLIPSASQSTPQISSQAEGAKVEQAYACLQNQLTNKSTFSLEEAAFGVLALGNQDKLIKALQGIKHGSEACWPKSGCTIRETALVALAYRRAGIPTSDIEQWLESKRITPRELVWYLEIDTAQHAPASCTIKYDGRDYSVAIKEDMTLSDDAGSCLQRSPSSYWLTISPTCMGKTIDVSCDKDFVTALVYQKVGGETVYVSSATHAAASLGTTSERVNVSCLSTGGGCDYQGTLWATYALHTLNRDTSALLPYVIALADDTTKYFPSAFLYMLTKDPDREYYGQILQQRKQNQFWEFVGNGYTRFYDTSVGVLALSTGSGGSGDVVKTQAYLLNVQTKEGCWNNNHFRDTAFILYASWPKSKVSIASGKVNFPQCREGGFSCERLSECLEAGGVKHDSYECAGGSICCSVKVQKSSCASQLGSVCKAGQVCEGSMSASSDGQCCIGTCAVVQEKTACERAGGTCASACGKDEKEVSESCGTTSSLCCVIDEESGGSLWPWILILGILIVLLIIAILKRDALRLWWFKRRGRASSSPVMKPGVPPSGGAGIAYRAPPRMTPPPGFARVGLRPALRPSPTSKDNEMEETMRKLKEMSG